MLLNAGERMVKAVVVALVARPAAAIDQHRIVGGPGSAEFGQRKERHRLAEEKD